jgi:hypothetical protein
MLPKAQVRATSVTSINFDKANFEQNISFTAVEGKRYLRRTR